MESFKDLLIHAREEKKLNKSQTAEHFGWTPMYYGRFENGQLLPNKKNIKKFADFLGIDIKELEEIIGGQK